MSWIIPYTGYLATALLALSLLVTTDLKFRWLNALGCVSFVVYGLLIQAMPVVFTNVLLLGINMYYLFILYQRKEAFDVIPFQWDEPVVEKFTQFYKKDMEAYYPGFTAAPVGDEIRFLVLRNMVIANMFTATKETGDSVRVRINYTIPRFRDFKVGRFIFQEENSILKQHGVQELFYDAVAHKGHRRFLRVMGFSKNGNGSYRLRL